MSDSSPTQSSNLSQMVDQLRAASGLPKAEFKDTAISVQYTECGILAVGGFLTWWCFNLADGNLQFLWAAGVAGVVTVFVLVWVHKVYGNTSSLKHMHDSIVFTDRGEERTIRFDQLQGFSASWTDCYVNYVYSTTTVRFNFDVAGSFRVFQYDTAAGKGTLKYEQLEELQKDVTAAVSQRMREALLADGCVPWTLQLTITTVGIDYRKRGTGEPELIPFSRLGKWEVSEGVFKLALDDDRRPSITENTSQTNFFPGLVLFAELYEEFAGNKMTPTADRAVEAADAPYVAVSGNSR